MGALPKVVIVGAGFGGLRCAKALGDFPVEVTVIDRSNHHLFQPLLYQVATATLSPADIASPIRSVLRDQANSEVLMAEVTGVDTRAKEVALVTPGLTERAHTVRYDYLVLATGARHAYFGHEAWEKFAPGLKSIPDATAIRQKILFAFEAAEMEPDAQKRAELLHFVLVGGGPTGVEMAGAIAELSGIALARDFRRINPRAARITLIEANRRILASFPELLSQRARADLEALGVEVRTEARVSDITEEGVWIGRELIRSHTVIWTAGVMASPAGQWIHAETDRVGRVKVLPDCSVPGHPEIFVIGDTAYLEGPDGKPLPGVAPVAMQQGSYVASAISQKMGGIAVPPPFRYRDKGSLATIGRKAAVADLGFIRLTGIVAWAAWLLVHIFYLIGFRNRVVVLMEWAWSYFYSQRGARLITTRLFSLFL